MPDIRKMPSVEERWAEFTARLLGDPLGDAFAAAASDPTVHDTRNLDKEWDAEFDDVRWTSSLWWLLQMGWLCRRIKWVWLQKRLVLRITKHPGYQLRYDRFWRRHDQYDPMRHWLGR